MRNFSLVAEELEKLINDKGLITIGEAAKLRGVTRSAILQLVQRKRLKTEKIVGKTLIYRDEIENFEEQKRGVKPQDSADLL